METTSTAVKIIRANISFQERGNVIIYRNTYPNFIVEADNIIEAKERAERIVKDMVSGHEEVEVVV